MSISLSLQFGIVKHTMTFVARRSSRWPPSSHSRLHRHRVVLLVFRQLLLMTIFCELSFSRRFHDHNYGYLRSYYQLRFLFATSMNNVALSALLYRIVVEFKCVMSLGGDRPTFKGKLGFTVSTRVSIARSFLFFLATSLLRTSTLSPAISSSAGSTL